MTPVSRMTLDELNALDRDAFTRALGGAFEHSPWIAHGAWQRRPFADLDALHRAMLQVVADGGHERQLALIRAHPELAGKAMLRRELTADSTSEQSGAGLDRCSPAEFARLHALNAAYVARFGFPFILAVRGYDRAGILARFEQRIENDPATEFEEALAQIGKITRFRLETLLQA